MRVVKPDLVAKNIWALRVEITEYLENPIIKYIPTPKGGDKWFADIFIEKTLNENQN